MELPEVIEIFRKHAAYFTTSGNDYNVSMVTLTPDLQEVMDRVEPMAMPGLSFMLVTRGDIEMELNTEIFAISADTVLVTDSRTLQKVKTVKSPKAIVYFLSLTPEFIKSLNIDINVLQRAHLRTSSDPIILTRMKETNMLVGYLNLLHENASTNQPNSIYTKNISRSLIAAMIYQMMQIVDRTYVSDVSSRMTSKKENGSGTRRINYVKTFMELIHQYYSSQRSLRFYADKMCISPKYLSAIIKESTNRSAAEWIDEYVMLEAKNMLRFSGMNIQQVAYALNFRNQSAFGKYFKHLAGMSPSQFQKS